MFVLASKHFQKCFSVNVSVWLRMENKFSENAFQLIVCFSWFDPEMVWSEKFHFKPFLDSCVKREKDRTQIMPWTQSPKPFDFAVQLRLQIVPRLHPLTSPANLELRALRLLTLRLRLRITPRSHPLTSPANPKPRSRLRLHWDCTPGSHRSHWDRTCGRQNFSVRNKSNK